VVALTSLTGCNTINTFQTGRSLGKSNYELAASATFIKDFENTYDINVKRNTPFWVMNGAYGISDNLDIGCKFGIGNSLSPFIKRQFIGDKNSFFASSLALETGINLSYLSSGNFDYYVTSPLIMSIHPKDYLSFYLSPRYIFSTTKVYASVDPTADRKDNASTFGSSLGVIFGKKYKIAFEVSSFNNTMWKPTQFSIGLIFTDLRNISK
jgi:hypothetical protein